jgi:ABC-type transporter Mla MlaB component
MSSLSAFEGVPGSGFSSRERATEREAVRVAPDLAIVPELREQLEELRDAGFQSLVLDLRGVTFIDSGGLHLIVSWNALARESAVELLQAADTALLEAKHSGVGIVVRAGDVSAGQATASPRINRETNASRWGRPLPPRPPCPAHGWFG